jgi:hypothetical protein
MAARKLVLTGAVLVAVTAGSSGVANATPPVGTCPSPFVTRTLDFFANDPPELVESVNKNGDGILCTRDFPVVSGHPGGNVIDNTAAPH